MDNLGILIQAILSLKDTTASKNQIAKELPKLESQLQSDKNTRVKVVAGLDISKSKNLIQSPLNTLTSQAKSPTIKVGVDVKSQNSIQNTANGLKNVQSQAQQTAESVKQAMTEITSENISSKTVSEFQKAFNIIGQNAKDTQQTFKGLFAELNNAWYAGDEEKYLNVLEQIYNIAQNTTKVVNKSKSEIKELTDQIRSDFTDSSTAFISPKTKEELKYLLEDSKKIKRVLDSVFGVGKWTYNQNKGVGTDVLANDIKELQGNANEILEVYKQIQNIKSSTQHTVFDSLGGDSASKDAINEHLHNVLNLTDAYRDLQGVEHTYIQGWGWFEDISNDSQQAINNLDNLNSKIKELGSLTSLSSSKNYFSDNSEILKSIQLFDQEEDAIKSLEQTFKSLGATVTSEERRASNGSLDGFTLFVKSATGEIEKFYYQYKNLNAGIEGSDENWKYVLTNITATDQGIQRLITSTQKAQDRLKAIRTSLTSDLKVIRSSWQDANGGKSVKSDENISKLNQQYMKAAQAIRDLRNVDETTANSIKANANAQIDKLKQMVSQYHNAEKVATQLRAKGFETVKIDTGNNIDKFINSINNSKVPIQAMQTEINKLTSDFAQLDNIQDQAGKSNALTNILNTLDNAKTKFQSIKELFKGYGNSDWLAVNSEQINKIDDIATKAAIYKKNLVDTREEWKTQGLYVGKIAEKATSLGRSISGIKKPEKFEEWVTEWIELNDQANKLKINLDSQVESQNKIYEIQAKINSLDPNKNSNEIAKLQESLSLEEKKISNLQFQSNVYSKLISKEEKENYIINKTAEAREKLNTSFAKLEDKSIQSQAQQLKDYENQINKTVSKLNSLQNSNVFSKNASNPQVAQTKQDLSDLTKEYQKLMTQMQGDITPAGLETLGSELNKLNTRFNSVCASAEQFERGLKDDNSAKKLAQNVSVLTARIETFRKVNKKSEKLFGGEYDRILSQLSNPNIDLETYNRLNKEFQKLRLEINKADKAGQSFFGKLKDQATKFASWMTLTGIIAGAWREVQKMITEVVELDNSLLELSKVSDLTADGLKQITTEAYSLGKEVGKTGTQVIDAITNFKRAGFDLQQSTSFAKDALILTNVAEGIDDASEAATALISIMKGYGDTTPEFSQKILDSINEVKLLAS